MEGRDDGWKDGWMEGRKEEWMKGREDGRKERRMDGRKEGKNVQVVHVGVPKLGVDDGAFVGRMVGRIYRMK
jgi:hypothetical protein